VLLFKSILEFDRAAVLPDDKRKMPRYVLNDNFSFKTKLTLFQNSGAKISDSKGKDWSVTPVNLSVTGASVQLSLAAVAFQREKCLLKFSHGEYRLEIPATIAHFRCCSQYSLCGIVFNFPTPELQQSYLQLLEPLIIGNSLAPSGAAQDTPGLHLEQFVGKNTTTTLSVWRDAPEGQITGFDFRMRHYGVQWADGAAELDVYGLGEADASGQQEAVALTETQHEEVRWLFCLAVPNLAKAVPLDVRRFLSALVA
jgi:hypothetical protein